MHDEKYIVFKRDEWQNFPSGWGEGSHGEAGDRHRRLPSPGPPRGCRRSDVRTQDIFASVGSVPTRTLSCVPRRRADVPPEGMMERLLEVVATTSPAWRKEAEDRLIRGECRCPTDAVAAWWRRAWAWWRRLGERDTEVEAPFR